VLATYLVVALVQLAVALWHARAVIAFLGFADGVSTVRTAIGQGLLIFGLDFSEFMMMQGTIWLATAAFLPLEATQYAAAVTLAMQVTVLESLSALAVVPPAARLWAAGRKDQVVRTLSNAATLNTAVVFVVLALLALFGPSALELAYGHAMRPAATMLMILAASAVFQAFFNRSITMLIVSGHIKEATRTALVVLAVSLPCAVAAAWLGGPIVLAVVTAASASAMPTCQWLTARKMLGRGARANYDLVRAVRELAKDPDA
jgi:O-antigen/teichoic acid export membrane protein